MHSSARRRLRRGGVAVLGGHGAQRCRTACLPYRTCFRRSRHPRVDACSPSPV